MTGWCLKYEIDIKWVENDMDEGDWTQIILSLSMQRKNWFMAIFCEATVSH